MSIYLWTQKISKPYSGSQAIKKVYLGTQVVFSAALGWTWNPSDKNANVTLSNGNLTAKDAYGSGNYWGRGTQAISSWKAYWEIKIDALWNTLTTMGVGRSNMGIANWEVVWGDANGWGFLATWGLKGTSNGFVSYGSSCWVNDIIGHALDMDAGTLTFYKNGTSMGQAFTWITWTVYPAYSLNYNDQITANFWDTAFAYTPPTWY